MQRLAHASLLTFALGSLAAAGSASAGTAPGDGPSHHVNFTVQLDADSLNALQAAGINAPTFHGSAQYDSNAVGGAGFDFLDTASGFNGFSFHITDRQAPGGASLPDLQFDLADATNSFGDSQVVFLDGEIQGFNFEAVPDAPTFGPEDVAFGQGQVRFGSGIIPGEGRGDLVFEEPTESDTHGDDGSSSVPTPTAFVAGLALLALTTRRRRRA